VVLLLYRVAYRLNDASMGVTRYEILTGGITSFGVTIPLVEPAGALPFI